MGDMNFDALTDNGHSKVTEIETSFILKQIISSPTRVTAVSQTLIDHIYVSSHLSPTESGVLPIPFSDHFPVFAVFPLCKSTHHTHQTIRKRTYKHFNYDAVIHELINSELFSTLYDQTDVSIAWSSFKTEFLRICNKYAPIQHIRVKYTSKNWITSNIRELIHKRNHAHQKALRTLSESDWEHYKSLRNTITCKIGNLRTNFINQKFNDGMWKILKQVLPSNNKPPNHGDISAQDFNEFFSSIGTNLTSDFGDVSLPEANIPTPQHPFLLLSLMKILFYINY